MKKREFVLTNGKQFIFCSFDGKYKQVNNLTMADTYESQDKATKIMLNSIPKSWSRNYYVAEVVDGEIIQNNSPRPQKVVKKRSEKCYHYNNDFFKEEWTGKFYGLTEIFGEALKRGRTLAQELSDIDSTISEMSHYIEFSNLNARDGYKAYRMLRKFLRERRNLKYELKIINAINSNRAASENISNIVDSIEECKNSKYTPKILNDLFEKGIGAIDIEGED